MSSNRWQIGVSTDMPQLIVTGVDSSSDRATDPVTLNSDLMAPVTVSLGAPERADRDASFVDLFVRADRALYRATSAGRNQAVSLT